MTYYQKEWNIYVASFLMKEVVKYDDAERQGEVKKESYFISVELFRCENPEEAYSRINAIANSGHLDSYHEGEDVVEIYHVGLNDLNLLQNTVKGIEEILERDEYGVDIATIQLPGKDGNILIREKKELSLFDEHYNYTGRE